MNAWPAVEHEKRPWELPEEVAAYLDVFEQHRRSRPYEAAVVPKIADLHPENFLSSDVLTLAREAAAAVIRFDSYAVSLPVTMPAVLVRTEAASSSQIENLTAGARNLAVAMLGLPSKENAAAIAANTASMTAALAAGEEISSHTVLQIHRTLMENVSPDIAGEWRRRQVWIGASYASPHGADFVAPHHSRLPSLIDDWCRFSSRRDIEPMVLTAISHAQFETLHPFEDGNGRTGRVLVHTALRRLGVTTESTVPVSAGLLRSTSQYFRALTAYREGEPGGIVEQMANGALAAVQNGRQLGAQLEAILQDWQSRIRARSDSTAWNLARQLFEQPVVDAKWVSKRLGVSDRGARNAIAALEDSTILTRVTAAQRNQVWQAPSVIAAMDAFAQRTCRRRLG